MGKLLQAATWPLRALVRLVAREASAAWHEKASSGLHLHFGAGAARSESEHVADLIERTRRRGYGSWAGKSKLVD